MSHQHASPRTPFPTQHYVKAVVEPTQDAVPKPRLRTRSGATEDNPLLPQPAADKPAGCAVPLIFEVSEGQRKKELALGISVRTSVGDSEEFESDTLEFMPGSQVRGLFESID